MLFLRILNFLKGYLIISVSGLFTERFINICTHRELRIWDIKYKNGEIYAAMAVEDFFKLRDVAYITKVRVRTFKRVGLPFLIKRYKRRWPIVFAVLLFIFIIYFLSSHIISIDVSGNERIPTDRIYAELSEVGVKRWVRSKDIHPERIRNEIMIMDEDVSWLGVNVRGSRVYIEVAERIDYKSIPHETEEICNVIATKDGVIEEICVMQGQGFAKRDDAVKKGELLISGIMDSAYGVREVHAYGEVIARTEYKEEGTYSLVYKDKNYKDNKKTLFGVKILDENYDLFSRKNIDYSRYEEQKNEYTIKFSVFDKDIEIGGIKYDFVEYEEYDNKKSVSEVVADATEELTARILEKVPNDAQVVKKDVEHNVLSGDSVYVCVTWQCRENIAEEVAIDEYEGDE